MNHFIDDALEKISRCKIWINSLFVIHGNITKKEEMIHNLLQYKDRMFREKPYTQCFECIQGNRLKCKKCMASIVEDILKDKNASISSWHPQPSSKQNHVRMSTTGTQIHRKAKEQFTVTTNFNIWIAKAKAKRNIGYDMLSVTRSGWPRKIIDSSQKIRRVEHARFQNWESRLRQRFFNSPSHHKLMQEVRGPTS